MKRYLLVHYAEIGLKGANKPYFVDKLRSFLKLKLEQNFRANFRVVHTLGRLMLELPEGFDEDKYAIVLRKIFGIKNFKFVYKGSVDLDKLSSEIMERLVLSDQVNFRVTVKRSMKLEMSSSELERKLGALVLEAGIGLDVKLVNPDLVLDVEFLNESAYFSFKKYEGAGGMAPLTQGKLLANLSSGIDSPVAAYMLMRRGARVVFLHFHGYPYTGTDEMDQVKDIVEILSDYQTDTRLYMIPFGEFQKDVGTNKKIPGKVRTIVYRRMMMRIASEISKRERAKGVITGDNFGQVASQTAENMFVVSDACSVPLYQPLIGFDKDQIVRLSEEIGTFEISKLPCKESCTMFASRKPELKANLYDIEEYEKNLPIVEWSEKILSHVEKLSF